VLPAYARSSVQKPLQFLSIIDRSGARSDARELDEAVFDLIEMTILLVDDDRAVLESLSRVFAMEGWQIVTAANGEEALERLAQKQPDLMITDLCMFGISSWNLLFYEKLNQPNLPISVITALPPTSVEGADRFATSFFQKPLDLDAMLVAIRHLFADSLSSKTTGATT
jgi:DNA-binding NtrC family response regulator